MRKRKRLETLDPRVWAEIRAGVEYGYCLAYLSEKYEVSLNALSRWTAEVPRPTTRATGYEKLLELEGSVLRDYQEEGIGMRELKRRFGVHEGTVRSFLQAKGVLKSRGAQEGTHNPQSKGARVDAKERDAGKYWARRVVEQALGMPLPKGWVIHHMNECPTDQTLTNLWLFPTTALHSLYHQRQRENLTTGGQRSANRLALDNGGLWLPQTLGRLQSEPDTALQSLCGMPG